MKHLEVLRAAVCDKKTPPEKKQISREILEHIEKLEARARALVLEVANKEAEMTRWRTEQEIRLQKRCNYLAQLCREAGYSNSTIYPGCY